MLHRFRVRRLGTRTAALTGAALVVCACGAVTAVPAVASAASGTSAASVTSAAPGSGVPAVENAPSSLTGVQPQIPADVTAASSAPGSTWRPEAATYGTAAKKDITVAGAGGTSISVDEYYPTNANGTPAKGPFPVVMTMTPYGKDLTSPGSGTLSAGSMQVPQSPESPTGGPDSYLVQRGYINVVMDIRGTGASGGQFGLFDPIQTQDEEKVLDWAAKLPGSDGKVGTYGPSYLGIDQMLLAGSVGKNSPLKAIFPDVASNDIYRDTAFMGGLIDGEFNLTYLGLTAGLNEANPLLDAASDPAVLSRLASLETDHTSGLSSFDASILSGMLGGGDVDYDESYWQQRSTQNLLSDIVANGIPAYLVGGEFDLFQNGEPLNYAGLQNAYDGRSPSAPMEPGQATTGRYQLLDGPWEHLNGAMANLDPLELEWFDTWLKGENTGMASTPTPLHYYDLGSGNFDETTTYPFTGAQPVKLYFGGNGSLSPAAPAADEKRTGDTIAWSPAGVPCGRPFDQWAMGALSVPAGTLSVPAACADDDRLTQIGPWEKTYTTAPFSSAQTLSGPINATVYAKANTTDTEWVAQVEVVTPSGQSYPLTEGALRGQLRAVDPSRSWTADGDTIYPYHPYTQASAEPVTPGATEEYQIQVFPTLATIPAGDRLRVTISTTDTPHLEPDPAQMAQMAGGVYQIQRTSSAPSSLTVELRPAG